MKLYTEEQVKNILRFALQGADESVIDDEVESSPWLINLKQEGNTIDTFIVDLLMIAPRWRKWPLVIVCPNGEEVYPSIKMGYENPLNMLVEDPSKMVITWRN